MNKINFWRTTNKTEIDFIIHNNQGLSAVEVKWNDPKQPRSFITMKSLYPEIETSVITTANYLT